ncbi:MAG TPA: hypothetical protein VN829_04450 [Dongiaceae bacterium]|nr:hypothetical protein [Dongiaceae bacterium]
MSALARRTLADLRAAQEDIRHLEMENQLLARQNERYRHEANLAYLEGLDQGRLQMGGAA